MPDENGKFINEKEIREGSPIRRRGRSRPVSPKPVPTSPTSRRPRSVQSQVPALHDLAAIAHPPPNLARVATQHRRIRVLSRPHLYRDLTAITSRSTRHLPTARATHKAVMHRTGETLANPSTTCSETISSPLGGSTLE